MPDATRSAFALAQSPIGTWLKSAPAPTVRLLVRLLVALLSCSRGNKGAAQRKECITDVGHTGQGRPREPGRIDGRSNLVEVAPNARQRTPLRHGDGVGSGRWPAVQEGRAHPFATRQAAAFGVEQGEFRGVQTHTDGVRAALAGRERFRAVAAAAGDEGGGDHGHVERSETCASRATQAKRGLALATRVFGMGKATEDAHRLNAVRCSRQRETMTGLDRQSADCCDRLRSQTKTPALAALSPNHALRSW